jgi:hypothetical protein
MNDGLTIKLPELIPTEIALTEKETPQVSGKNRIGATHRAPQSSTLTLRTALAMDVGRPKGNREQNAREQQDMANHNRCRQPEKHGADPFKPPPMVKSMEDKGGGDNRQQ